MDLAADAVVAVAVVDIVARDPEWLETLSGVPSMKRVLQMRRVTFYGLRLILLKRACEL